MNLKQLKYVLTVAKVGSISKAADELNISQPSLSQYLKKIETQLNVVLFDRTNGNCRLTDAGRVYVDTARQVIDLEHQMQNKFVDIRQDKIGSVIVGTTPFRSASMMPAIISKFRVKYPGVHVVVVEQGTQELKEAAERGEFDLCIVNLPVDDRIFKSEIIMEEELIVAVPKNSKLDELLKKNAFKAESRRFEVIDPKLLDGSEFVMLTEVQIMQKALSNLCKDHDLVLRTAAVVKSLESQIQMVCAGVGAALIPTGLVKFAGVENKVSYYSLTDELPRRKVAAIYRKDKYISDILKNLISDIKDIDW